MRIKICGITIVEQGIAIANIGATDLGFICVPSSPRYLKLAQLQPLVAELGSLVNTVGVFADFSVATISHVVGLTELNTVQLHGGESVEFCQELRAALPDTEIIKAWRVRSSSELESIQAYSQVVDCLLLDAYHPDALGGTGQTLDWQQLSAFKPPIPWLLAGGLNPDNICTALSQIHPDGIDLSSGLEVSPGHKNLDLVDRLFANLGSRSR
ncbi:phosphoribosylanthranilate isomerase [Chamaesiphon sp. VAR_48_metabat_135_sub]|uniref:phosphoribosylanthranilate isomerase n=1 Tax=Chamaesiphon sp. VAR_48_metabat_135_sub TaxID=2964699 RepID=UPI00286AFE63|nr:phosphoribosylanthranilate isomerase [Chamaesiphon sp. VAR_48_metabat_135_sub]